MEYINITIKISLIINKIADIRFVKFDASFTMDFVKVEEFLPTKFL